MKHGTKRILAAGLIAGTAALTGCSADTAGKGQPTPTNTAVAAATTQPESTAAQAQESPQPTEEAPGPIALHVLDKAIEPGAIEEEGRLMLPLEETAEALGYAVKAEEEQQESVLRRNVELKKDESAIRVTWEVSDNTNSRIVWQKDGLLIPVNTRITTVGTSVYVPAAFFEEAADVSVTRMEERVVVKRKPEEATAPQESPEPTP